MSNSIAVFFLASICTLFSGIEAADIDCPINNKLVADSLQDPRDGKCYDLIQIDSLIWFNEDLGFETENSALSIKGDKGRLYSFEESKRVCPQGWRLPTVNEFDHLIKKVFQVADFTGLASLDYNWERINENPLNFHFSKTAIMHKKKMIAHESFNIWLDAIEDHSSFHVHMYNLDSKNDKGKLTIFRHSHDKHKPKKNRKFAVRCVCTISTN